MYRFHIFIQNHFHGAYTARVLTHPNYVVYGQRLIPLREELREVLTQELSLKRIRTSERETFFEPMRQHAIHLELNAIQHQRLIRVPMRFTAFSHPHSDSTLFDIFLPRLKERFTLHNEENIIPWCEEIIRGFFYLRPVEELLQYQYERNETLEELAVKVRGERRYKQQLSKQKILDELPRNTSVLDQVGHNLLEYAQKGQLSRA
ncbi:MAG: hypothetical protein AAGJ35_01795, partial [Myxococcota bacterium]